MTRYHSSSSRVCKFLEQGPYLIRRNKLLSTPYRRLSLAPESRTLSKFHGYVCSFYNTISVVVTPKEG